MWQPSFYLSIFFIISAASHLHADDYARAVTQDAPAAYYRFPAVENDTVKDDSGNGRDGKLLAQAKLENVSATKNLGGCLTLSGAKDGLAVQTDGNRKIAFSDCKLSVECWLRHGGTDGWGAILNADAWANHAIHYQFNPGGALQFCVEGVRPEDAFLPLQASGVTPGAWHHLVVTYDGTADGENVRFYLDGKLAGTAKLGKCNAPTLGETFTIGNWRGERGFSGSLDELAIYDKILTQEQVVNHFRAAGKILPPEPEKPFRMADEVKKRLLDAGVEKIAFIKRFTYNSNHYYTDFINSQFMPGGNLCTLDVRTGEVRELCPELKTGVFERFDVNFDGTKIVFAWKKSADEGYRIYEVDVETGVTRQVVSTPENEAELVAKYRNGYHHGTDDMSPCYLPDGGICFISTRCQYGTLCDGPDIFTTTVLYRCDADGKNIRKLTNSALSEASPAVLSDGRVMYTRWEYVDKGAVSVKCLWAMRPDGTGTSEIYGNDVAFPPTFIYGREIPGSPNYYVFTGTPHYPHSSTGTIIRLDMNKNIRTREPMTYMTPYVDVRKEPGWEFQRPDGAWYTDHNGHGPLFRESYPLSMTQFLVSHKPAGPNHIAPNGFALFLLDDTGRVEEIYRDKAISCFCPIPLRKRPVPPVLHGVIDETLARKNLAHCMVMDVYHGMEDIPRGSVKYLRVLEQIPRPWAARRPDGYDEYDQQHATVSKDTALGLKVQHGVVPVAEDGSASFLVPAEANIFFQALDENYMAVQTERTYVNYMPGEVRSCVGCHETPQSVQSVDSSRRQTPAALKMPPQLPIPQRLEVEAKRVLDYAQDVQSVWDRHCLACHAPATTEHPDLKIEAGLNLSGEMTTHFNVSYENLVPERRRRVEVPDRKLLGPVIGENHPKTGNVHYLPAKSLGSHTSVLVALLAEGKVTLADEHQQARVERLRESHKDVHLAPNELLRVTNWVDTNCQYYGSYYGRRNLRFRDAPDFRPFQTFDMAVDKKEIQDSANTPITKEKID